MTLLLVRHAPHPDLGLRLTGRAPGAGLTPAGRRRAERLAARLVPEALTEVQTSPRARALETAGAIARGSGVALTVVPALDEIDFGDWTGADFAALDARADWRRWNARRARARPPGGESMAEAADRILCHVTALGRVRPGARIALVTHGDMIRGLVARCLGLGLDNLLRFEIAPASVSRIAAGPEGLRLLSLNECPA